MSIHIEKKSIWNPMMRQNASKITPAQSRHHAVQPDPRDLAHAVHGLDRHVAHAEVVVVQLDEEVVGEPVTTVEAIEMEDRERLPGNRGVSGLAVGHVPVARRDLGEHGQDGVAEVTVTRDDLPGLTSEQAVPLRVVRLVLGQWGQQARQVLRIHLGIAGHDGDEEVLAPLRHRRVVAGDDGRADAAVGLVADHLQAAAIAALGLFEHGRRAICRGIVHHDDAIDQLRHRVQDASDQLLFVVRGHDHEDAPVGKHGRLFYRGSL